MSNFRTVNLVLFGIGNVGSALIRQINALRQELLHAQNIHLRVPVITNSKIAFFDKEGASSSWEADFETGAIPYQLDDVIRFVKQHDYDHCVAIDATASQNFVNHYEYLIENGFHIVAANKAANTQSLDFYKQLRSALKTYDKQFFYETNVGAGLPVIETVSNLYKSGAEVKRIRGVFSGSLSYIFNDFSESERPFSKVIHSAANLGLTEPDVREDLSGKDVARKLLILSRELGFETEFSDVDIKSLIPEQLNNKATLPQFTSRLKELNPIYQEYKSELEPNEVLRYVGEFDVASQSLEVKLIPASKESVLGQLKGTDTLFEIYTDGYDVQPLVIQGAGAGREVTARGVLTDILKVAQSLS